MEQTNLTMEKLNNYKKDIFAEAKKAIWDLNIVSKKFNISINNVTNIIYDYALNNLNLDHKEFNRYKRYYIDFTNFLNLKIINRESFIYAYNFYIKYANNDELQAFKNTTIIILNNVLNKDNLSIKNYLKEIHLIEYDLIILSKISNNNNISIYKILEPYFQFCEQVKWNREDIKKQAQNMGISYDLYLKTAYEYGTHVLNIKDMHEYKLITRNSNNKKPNNALYIDILTKILLSDDELQINDLFNSFKFNKGYISRYSYCYLKNKSKEEQTNTEKNLLTKYYNYLKQKKKPHYNVKYTKSLYEEFIRSSDEITLFCQKNNLILSVFKKRIKQYPDLIVSFNTKINNTLQEFNKEHEKRIYELLFYLKNGKVINNITYPFDIIDFLVLFPEISIYKPNCSFLDIEDIKLIKTFLDVFKNNKTFKKDNLINSIIYLNLPDSNRPLSTKEITYLINYLEELELPNQYILFKAAIKKYLNGEITICDNKKLVLK